VAHQRFPKPKEIKEIQKARKLAGLKPLKLQIKNCLCCGKEFQTMDSKNQHTCDLCRRDDDSE